MNDATRMDIAENIYDTQDLSGWNLHTFKDHLDGYGDQLPQMKVVLRDVAPLYEDVISRWQINDKNVLSLQKAMAHGDLDPVIMNGDEFFDGGHRVVAYWRSGRKKIPAIDISHLLKMDWNKWFEGEVEF